MKRDASGARFVALLLVLVGLAPVTLAAPSQPTGTVVIGSSSEIINPDPVYNTFLNDVNLVYVNLYDTLVVRRPDGSLAPHLAESWRMINPTTWEFKLRRGVEFHNGEAFNAEAVKATIDRYLEPNKRRAPFVAQAIAGASVVGDYTIRIMTPKPDPVFLENTVYFMYPIPPNFYRTVGDDGFGKNPVGTGPFRYISWVKGDRMVLEANTRYWKGAPKFRRLEIRIIPEIATRISALRAGEIDIAMQLTPDQKVIIEADPRLKVTSVAIPRIIYLITWTEGAGEGTQALKDKRVRQALNYAINVDSITRNLLGGEATRSATIIPPLAFGYDNSIAPYPYEPERAKQLLAQAGLPNGFTVDMDVPNGGNPLKPVEVGQAIAADLARVGIRVRLRVVDAASYISMRNDKKLAPIFMWNWYGYDGDLPVWGNAHPDFPFSFYRNPAVIKLIDEERTTTDVRRRTAAFKLIQQILKEEAPFVALYQQHEIYGVNTRIDWSAKPGGHVFLWDTAIAGR